jgi:hypothetical protein
LHWDSSLYNLQTLRNKSTAYSKYWVLSNWINFNSRDEISETKFLATQAKLGHRSRTLAFVYSCWDALLTPLAGQSTNSERAANEKTWHILQRQQDVRKVTRILNSFVF